MMDYTEFGANLETMVKNLYHEEENTTRSNKKSFQTGECREKGHIDKSFYEVRQSVCIAGMNGSAIRDVKSKIAGLLREPVALESFHVRTPEDVKDGALLVPKIVLVATHCPGKKVIDDEGNEGQLDDLYDAVADVGADIVLIYTNLPHSIYPPVRRAIYHPKMQDIVFPSQPLLRHLANENCFITISYGCELNDLQKNVLKEWLVRPINKSHPVYRAADTMYTTEKEKYSDTPKSRASTYPPMSQHVDGNEADSEYIPAEEEHPLADNQKKKRNRFGLKSIKRRFEEVRPGRAKSVPVGLEPLDEDEDEDNLEMSHVVFEKGSDRAVIKNIDSSSTAIF